MMQCLIGPTHDYERHACVIASASAHNDLALEAMVAPSNHEPVCARASRPVDHIPVRAVPVTVAREAHIGEDWLPVGAIQLKLRWFVERGHMSPTRRGSQFGCVALSRRSASIGQATGVAVRANQIPHPLDLALGAGGILFVMTGIGPTDFSAATGLSPKALRLYEERGLLRPAFVDPVTGYRRYAASQLDVAARIALLRRAGIGLAASSVS